MTAKLQATFNVVLSNDPWALLDGRTNAPAGVSPQFPNLLNNYVPGGTTPGRYRWPTVNFPTTATPCANYQPQWMVAGVDYGVGIHSGVSLANPSTLTGMSGVTVGAGNVQVTGNNVTISGIDFSASGGYELELISGTNTTITDCKFQVLDATYPPPIVEISGHSGTTITYCLFNVIADDASTIGSCMQLQPDSTCLVEYCYFQATNGHQFVGAVFTIKYNLSYNTELSGVHCDWTQFDASTPNLNYPNLDISYNCWNQPTAVGNQGGLGIGIGGGGGSGSGTWTVAQANVSNNVFVLATGANIDYCVDIPWNIVTTPTGHITGPITLGQNYTDPTGLVLGYWYTTQGTIQAGASLNSFGNFYMTTGAAVN